MNFFCVGGCRVLFFFLNFFLCRSKQPPTQKKSSQKKVHARERSTLAEDEEVSASAARVATSGPSGAKSMRKGIVTVDFFLVAATGEMVAKTSVGELAAKKYAIRSERTRQGMWN